MLKIPSSLAASPFSQGYKEELCVLEASSKSNRLIDKKYS